MKITKIHIKNLFSYDEFEIELDKNINVIVGPNNAGKTNLFRTIKLLMDIIDGNIPAREIESYLNDPSNEKAEIKIWVEFDKDERKTVQDFLDCYFYEYLENFEQSINKNKPPINDILPEYGDSKGRQDKRTLNLKANKLFIRSFRKFIESLAGLLGTGVFVWEYSGEYDTLPAVRLECPYTVDTESIKEFLSVLDEDNTGHKEILDKYSLPETANLQFVVYPEYLKVSYPYVHSIYRGYHRIWDVLPTQYKTFINAIGIPYVLPHLDEDRSHVVPPDLFFIFLAEYDGLMMPEIQRKGLKESKKRKAKRVFNKVGVNFSKDSLSLHKLMLKLFYGAIIRFPEIRGYPQSNPDNVPERYDGSGYKLADYLFNLKNSNDPEKYRGIQREFKEILKPNGASNGSLSFEVIQNKNAIQILINEDGKQYNIQRVASGIFEVLNILTVIHGNHEKVILLDEPALHLHSVFQRKILERLYDLTTNNHNQILIITHSPYLLGKIIRPDFPGKVHRFYKRAGYTNGVDVKQCFSELRETKLLRGDQIIRALFASGVIIAEGVSEYISLLELVPKLGYHLEDYNIELILCNGKKEISQFISLFSDLKIPYCIVCDEDTVDTDLKEFYINNPNSVFYSRGFHDWSDYLTVVFPIKLSGGKVERVWKIIKTISPEDAQNKLKDLQEFIEKFTSSL